MKTVVICCSGEDGILKEAVGAASFLGCTMVRIKGSDNYREFGDIILFLPVSGTDIDDHARDMIKSSGLTGKRIYPVLVHRGLFGRAFRTLKKILPSCRIERPLLLKMSKDGKIDSGGDLRSYLEKIRKGSWPSL